MIEINNDRYSRLEIIPWWNQITLKNAKIFIAGCGALGNEIVKNLVMLGAGKLFVADMDKVEESNLTRSIFFREEDKGVSKAKVVAGRAKEINPGVEIEFYDGNIMNLGLGFFKEFDIIIGGLDNREARLYINQSCWKVNKPWIDGAIEVLNGVARVFIPPDGACYECTMNEQDYKLLNRRKSCLLLGIDDIAEGKIPTTPTIASIIAAIQVQEAVKFLHQRTDLLLLNGKGFVFNGTTNDSYLIEYQRKKDCPSHYSFDNIYKLEKSFNEVTVEDIFNFGKKIFKKDFILEFNNEIAFTENAESISIIGNMNLLSASDLKNDKNEMTEFRSFHNLKSHSDFYDKIKNLTLKELKLPLNDILILRNNEIEVQVEFENIDVFEI
jgi:molybdopterin/thiamine biosynthesis adenylyltransferase